MTCKNLILLFAILLITYVCTGCASVIVRPVISPSETCYPGYALYFGAFGGGDPFWFYLLPPIFIDLILCGVFDTALLPFDVIYQAIE